MLLLVAPDSFKGSLSATQAAESMQRGFSKVFPDAAVRLMPLADGGEGTVEALTQATDGAIINTRSYDPLMRPIPSFFGKLGHENTAVVEMAAASGMALLHESERNPLHTTTYGTGELIRQALEAGCTKVIVGLGGSATSDGGAGMAQALGVKLLDTEGKELPPGGEALNRLERIDASGLDLRIRTGQAEIVAACDVDNPLTGKRGAARVYAPQKGATPDMVETLEAGLQRLGEVIERDLDVKVVDVPGAGAAGGLGAGLMGFLRASLQPGFEIVKQAVRLEEAIQQADYIFTGEGRIDEQTLSGKAPAGVARLGKQYSKPVIGFCGSKGSIDKRFEEAGFTAIHAIMDASVEEQDAVDNAGSLLEKLVEEVSQKLTAS